MSFNGSGVWTANSTGLPVVTGTVISSTMFAALLADLATSLTLAYCKDGQSTPSANLPMGNYKLTGLGAPTVAGDALRYGDTLTVPQGGTGAVTLTGIVKGAGTAAFAAATAGTDYVAPGTATNFTALQTFTGTSSNLAAKFVNAKETITISATAATGTINYDATTQSVLYYTSSAAANWTVNLRASAGTTMNTALSTGESISVVFAVTNGATPYYNTVVQVDGTAVGVTTKWLSIAPSAGTASAVDVYTYEIVKTGSAVFTVFASQSPFV